MVGFVLQNGVSLACWEHKRERCHLCGQSCTTHSWLVALSNCAKESFLSESSNKWRSDSNYVIRAWSSFLRPQRKAQRLWTSGRPWKAWAGGQSPSLNHALWFQKKYWSFVWFDCANRPLVCKPTTRLTVERSVCATAQMEGSRNCTSGPFAQFLKKNSCSVVEVVHSDDGFVWITQHIIWLKIKLQKKTTFWGQIWVSVIDPVNIA